VTSCFPTICKLWCTKFWWSQELNELKAATVTSTRAWKEAGKPKYGPIFQNYYKDKLAYKQRIREDRQQETMSSPTSCTMPYCVKMEKISGNVGTLKLAQKITA